MPSFSLSVLTGFSASASSPLAGMDFNKNASAVAMDAGIDEVLGAKPSGSDFAP